MMRSVFYLFAFMFFLLPNLASSNPKFKLPEGFVYLHEIDPSIIIEMRYSGSHNFIGSQVPGYLAPHCILTQQAAEGLKKVQTILKDYQMSLKVYDCYRPQRAVDSFVAWAKDRHDVKMKKEFYPSVDKSVLFKDGYIAEKSGHSRGSTIDLTLVALPAANQPEYVDGQKLSECYLPASQRYKDNSMDFGTGFDCFDPLAHTDNKNLDFQSRKNRLLLRSIMREHNFENYPNEWWHFTLKDEPFPERYFDFVVQ